MDYVKGHCTTNRDDYITYVTRFYRVPNPGERVGCLYRGRDASLKVYQVTHTIKDEEPYIIVELNN